MPDLPRKHIMPIKNTKFGVLRHLKTCKKVGKKNSISKNLIPETILSLMLTMAGESKIKKKCSTLCFYA